MPSDFGDEAGEKLFDWMLRIGQDAGAQAMSDSADRLMAALKHTREGLTGDAGKDTEKGGEASEWLKLDMSEYAELPEYKTLKEAIDAGLDGRGVEHAFSEESGKSFLVFRTKDVHEVDGVFAGLETAAGKARNRAAKEIEPAKERSANLDAPATAKQIEFIESLEKKEVIPKEEIDAFRDGMTVGAANGLLNKYAHYLDLKSEPLEARAARARAASKALSAERGAEREMQLSQNLAK